MPKTKSNSKNKKAIKGVRKAAKKTTASSQKKSHLKISKNTQLATILSALKTPFRPNLALPLTQKQLLNALRKPNRKLYLAVIVAGVLLLLVYKKNILIAATVNGYPITSVELLSKMSQQYHSQVLNQLINEKIIEQEATKKGVGVSASEVNAKLDTLSASVGGKDSLDALLSQQGQTEDTLKEQIKTQILVEKLYGPEATVSTSEVQKYLEQNKNQLQATDSAGQEKEAADSLKQQKLSQIFQQKFSQLKQNAKVQIF